MRLGYTMEDAMKIGTHRLRSQGGFTLIEILVALIILGVLLAIAVPSYIGFRDRANNSAAQANIRAAVPAVEAWNADHQSGYVGVSLAGAQSYDPDIKRVSIYGGTAGTPTVSATYCISSKVSTGDAYYKSGPGGTIGKSPSC